MLTAFVKAGLASSNGEARRAIANNAIMVNDTRVTSDKATISEADVDIGWRGQALARPETSRPAETGLSKIVSANSAARP